MKLTLHAVAAVLGIEDCSMSTLDAAATALSIVSPYSGAAITTDFANLRSCTHESDAFKEGVAAGVIVIVISIGAYVISRLVLPRTPPQKAEDAAKFSHPRLVAHLESIPFFGVIMTMTFLDLGCSIIEMLAMRWLLGHSLDPTVKHWAEHFGLAITLWMVVEQHTSIFAHGFKIFFSSGDNSIGYVAVMIDLFFDLFAEDMAGFAGLLLIVRLFKIYRVYDAFHDVDQHLKHIDEVVHMQQASSDYRPQQFGDDEAPAQRLCC